MNGSGGSAAGRASARPSLTGTCFRLVHLDLDGTLVDTREDLVGSTNYVRCAFGLEPLAPEGVYALVGHGARALVERALGEERRAHHDEGVRLLLEHYGEHCLDRSLPYPGLVGLVDRLRAEGVTFTVLTNKLERLARKVLDGLGLTPRLAGIVGGDTFPERKPDPRGAEHLRAACGEARERTLMVGDSPVDVATARAAGIGCCGVLWGLDPDGLVAAGPEWLAGDAAGLEAVIRSGTIPD